MWKCGDKATSAGNDDAVEDENDDEYDDDDDTKTITEFEGGLVFLFLCVACVVFVCLSYLGAMMMLTAVVVGGVVIYCGRCCSV